MGKGSDFERDQCRFLSLWWTEGKYNDVFWRKRVRSTRKSVDAKFQLGDIKAERPEGDGLMKILSIELKTGYSVGRKGKHVRNVPWDLLDLIDFRKGSEDIEKKQLIKFWRQTTRDAEIDNKYPLLIFKRDFHVPVVCIHNNLFDQFENCQGRYNKRFIIFYSDMITKEQKQDNVDGKDDLLVLFRAEDFFSWLNPETIKSIDPKV